MSVAKILSSIMWWRSWKGLRPSATASSLTTMGGLITTVLLSVDDLLAGTRVAWDAPGGGGEEGGGEV